MHQRLPEQWNGPPVADNGENHHAEAVPQHRGVERQMQGAAWVLPVLNRPENQRAIEGFHVNAAVGEPAPAATLPAGCQAMGQRQTRLQAIETDGFAQQQPGDHPGEEHQMALVTDRTVLTQKAGELTVEPGSGFHEGLDWCGDPNFSRLPAHPIS
jgi:hypothetical protein